MMEILDSLREFDEEEAKLYMQLLFDGYMTRKKEKRLFEETNRTPQLIILTYYTCVKKPQFNKIYELFKNKYISEDEIKKFRERYIYNENKLEDVHTREEKLGLRKVYDYIQAKEDLDNINLYTLSDIHEILYSHTPYPEYGGKYRTDMRFLPNSGVDLTPPYLIVHEMNALKPEIDELVAMGNELGRNIEPEKILDYVDRCIELKCKFIKIHPFFDGNGRSVRAFTNLLFRLANIPPVYIENKERVKYGEAMNAALADNDLSKIKGFYYYKICDSIISLDMHLETDKHEEQEDDKSNLGKPPVKKLTVFPNNKN
ncbi:MAG: Fic family protein [Bacilli bacterium]|nr:Fic family protein [Bacilli bacterium]